MPSAFIALILAGSITALRPLYTPRALASAIPSIGQLRHQESGLVRSRGEGGLRLVRPKLDFHRCCKSLERRLRPATVTGDIHSPAVLCATLGTIGIPKFVIHTQATLAALFGLPFMCGH
jgi:hypothetical protein